MSTEGEGGSNSSPINTGGGAFDGWSGGWGGGSGGYGGGGGSFSGADGGGSVGDSWSAKESTARAAGWASVVAEQQTTSIADRSADASKTLAAGPTDAKTDVVAPTTDSMPKAADNAKPVEVQVAPANADSKNTANMYVDKDGKVSYPRPYSGSGAYQVAVEPSAPPEAVNTAMSSLHSRMTEQGYKVGGLSDSTGQLTDDTKNLFQPVSPEEKEPEPAPEDEGNDPGGGGGGGGGDRPDPAPPDDTKPDSPIDQNVEVPVVATPQDIVNSFAGGDYLNGKNGSLGAFNMNFNQSFGRFCGFTDEEMAEFMGPPPDVKKMRELLAKKGKAKEGMAKMKDQGFEPEAAAMDEFLTKLNTNDQFAGSVIEMMKGQKEGRDAFPQELQECFSDPVQRAFKASEIATAASDAGLNLKAKPPTEQDLHSLLTKMNETNPQAIQERFHNKVAPKRPDVNPGISPNPVIVPDVIPGVR